jgi:guanylate kinase
MFINHHPFVIIISSPSGAGKTTLCKMIVQNDPLIKLSISATTREKRPQEQEGVDYFFVSNEQFEEMKDNHRLLEYATVFNNKYATPKQNVNHHLANGHCVLFDIDWQGARQIKQKYQPSDSVVSIFILPPSLQELERRLKARAQDSLEIVAKRMQEARNEISHYHEYDFIIINDDLNNSYQKIKAIIEAKRVARQNQQDISDLINQFL